MAKHSYTIWLTYGFTVKADDYLEPDNDTDFDKLKRLAIKRLEDIGLYEIVSEGDFSEIIYDEEGDY
jgi:hypothetical protein